MIYSIAYDVPFSIADRHPLKQGLKLPIVEWLRMAGNYRRPTSTKTRIETTLCLPGPYSWILIADRHPLKQGLKRKLYHL